MSTNTGIYIGRNTGQGSENYSGGNITIGYLSGEVFMSTSDNNVFVGQPLVDTQLVLITHSWVNKQVGWKQFRSI